MEEKWRDIAGFEGLYMVSNFGNIKRLKRLVRISEPNRLHNRQLKERFLILNNWSDTYLSVGLTKDNKTKRLSVHRLVAENFILNPRNKPCVNHIDGNKKNNNYTNLEWVTYGENAIHAHKFGLRKRQSPMLGKTGVNCPNSKKILQLTKDNKILAQYNSITEASIKNNISHGNISSCCCGRIKTSGGFIWKFI